MPATQVAHGVIQINVPNKFKPEASATPAAPAQVHPVATNQAPPAPVVQHKTAAEIEAEAAQLAIDVAAAGATSTTK